jgi:hypothetical protein
MKEVVLTKNLGYLQLDTANVTAAIGPTTYGMGQWETTTLTNVFVMKEEIDVAGLTAQELTFFPLAGDVQRGPTALGLAYQTGGVITEWIYVTAAPIDFRVNNATMLYNLVGQGSTCDTEFQNVIWGQAWTWAFNASVPSNFALPVNTTMMGSGEPTNGDRLYVYRVVSTLGFTPAPGSFAELPSVRLLISGQLKEEQEFQQIMRMRRSYELQQLFDED